MRGYSFRGSWRKSVRYSSRIRKPRVNYGWGHWIGGKKAAIDYASKKGAGW